MIQDNNWLYNLLSPLVKYGTRCHYNSFVVRGIENLPSDAPYIIAPCHQQALMEPLAVLRFAPKPPVFLARADIFKKPAQRKILTFLKIMPVYRIRDGKDSLGQNQEVFDHCRDVLLDGYPLCLMAEGRHNNRHHLLNMGKGMFRIAGETQLALGDQPLYIVPTGIDFDDYERPYSNLVVNIGQPIAVQPFMATYRENEPLALNQMRVALTKALLPLMHDIRSDEHYDAIMTLCNVLNSEMRRREGLRNNAWNRFRMRQHIAQRLDHFASSQSHREEFTLLMEASEAMGRYCRRVHLDERVIGEHWSLGATLLAALVVLMVVAALVVVRPLRLVALFLILCYPLPLLPTHLVVKRKVNDPQFRSSFNFGVRFALSIVYALVIGIVMAACNGAWMDELIHLGAMWGLVAIGVVVVGARATAPLVCAIRSTVSNCRYWLMRLTHHIPVDDLLRRYDNLND